MLGIFSKHDKPTKVSNHSRHMTSQQKQGRKKSTRHSEKSETRVIRNETADARQIILSGVIKNLLDPIKTLIKINIHATMQFLCLACFCAIFLSFAGYIAVSGYKYFTTSALFNIRHIKICFQRKKFSLYKTLCRDRKIYC